MDWKKFDAEIQKLASRIANKPDIIIGVVRGGLIPARLLAKYLGVKDMYALTVKKLGTERVLLNEITEQLTGKTVLLVEDVLESAGSMIIAKEYLESRGANVVTASLYVQPQSRLAPDYFLGDVTTVPIFPWD